MTTIELELWHLITLAIASFGAFAGAGKAMLAQTQRHLDERFVAQEAARQHSHEATQARLISLESAAREEAGQWQRVERELLSLKADLPVHYVRREDYIRGQSVIESKLDGLATRIENAQLRSALGLTQGAPHHGA